MRLMLYNDNCSVKIGKNAYVVDMKTSLNGNSLEIGDNCLISNNVEFLTDCHSVLDIDSKIVLNKPKDAIKIGNKVWIGQNAAFTKNAQIPNNCVVGINSTVTKKFEKENCVIAGNPAKIVKENVCWEGKNPNVQ